MTEKEINEWYAKLRPPKKKWKLYFSEDFLRLWNEEIKPLIKSGKIKMYGPLMDTHTPGPWTAAPDDVKENTIFIGAPKVGYVAEIHREDGLTGDDWQDAALIEQAPSFLAALEDLNEGLNGRTMEDDPVVLLHTISKAHNVVLRALLDYKRRANEVHPLYKKANKDDQETGAG